MFLGSRVKLYLSILIIILSLIAILTTNSQSPTPKGHKSKLEQNGVYGWPAKIINAQNLLPYNRPNIPLIAVIDSGADLTNQYINKDQITNIVLDEISKNSKKRHGTKVIGLLVANGDGYTTPGGMLSQTRILSIQAGTDEGMTIQQLSNAIDIAVDYGAKIINISYGIKQTNKKLEDAIFRAIEKNTIVVASSGNYGEETNYYPAAYKNVIAVSSLKKSGEPDTKSNQNADNIYAPGDYLLTTSSESNDQISWFSGSSASTAIVTAVCAMVSSKEPTWGGERMNKWLLSSATLFEQNNREYHILNVKKALIGTIFG